MSKVKVTVTNDGETVIDKECDAVMLGLIADDESETITEAPRINSFQLAMLITALLKHLEDTQERHPEVTDIILLINKMMNMEDSKE